MRYKWMFVFGSVGVLSLLYYCILEENKTWEKQLNNSRVFEEVLDDSYLNNPIAYIKEKVNIRHPELILENWSSNTKLKGNGKLESIEVNFKNGHYILQAITPEGESYDVRLIRKGNGLYQNSDQ